MTSSSRSSATRSFRPRRPGILAETAERPSLDKQSSALDVYQRLHLPMLDDRDFAMHVTWNKSGDGREIHFSTMNDKCPAPPDKGVTRVPLHEAAGCSSPSRVGGART